MSIDRNPLYERYVSTHAGEKNLNISRNEKILFQQFEKNFLELLKNFPTKSKILDLGCGNGILLRWLAARGYENCVGFDLSSEQIEQGKSFGTKNIFKGDILEERLYFESDIIFLRDVIEHLEIEENIKLFSLISKYLSKDGIVIIQTVNGDSAIANTTLYGDATHKAAFTKRSIEQLLQFVNMRLVSVVPWYRFGKSFQGLVINSILKILLYLRKLRIKLELGNVSSVQTVNCIYVGRRNV